MVTLVVMFLVGEVAVRIFDPFATLEYEADEDLLWRLRPAQEGFMTIPGKRVPTSVSADGFRGASLLNQDDQRPRVLVLGDSFTFGSGVEDKQTFSAILEAVSDGAFSVFNGGGPGWGLFQFEALFNRIGESVRPAYVLVVLPDFTVFRQPFADEADRTAFLLASRRNNTLRSVSKLGTLVWRQLVQLELAGAGQATPNARPIPTKGGSEALEAYRELWLKDRERLLAMNQHAQELGAQLLVVGWPSGMFYSDFFRQEVEDLNDQGVWSMDLHAALGNFTDRPDLRIPGDGHPNAKAHRIVGERLYQRLNDSSP